MASIRKRGDKYHVQVRIKGFEPATASFERLADAKEWAAKTETELRASKYFGQSKRRTFNELAEEYQPQAKDIRRLKYWRSVLGNLKLADISPERINKEVKKLMTEDTPRFSTPATGNAELDANRVTAGVGLPKVNGLKLGCWRNWLVFWQESRTSAWGRLRPDRVSNWLPLSRLSKTKINVILRNLTTL